jgi:transcriptional regulator with XRE-family HTH domain
MLNNHLVGNSGDELRALIRRRLEALGINSFEAARRVGAQRTFVNDILSGRKQSVRGDNLRRLADALEMDLSELAALIGQGTAITGLEARRESRPLDDDAVGGFLSGHSKE